MMRYEIGRAIEADLVSAWEYIARDSLDAADRWVATIFEAFELLADDPGIGHVRRDLTELAILFWPVGSYLILYRAMRGWIEIVAVVHGARDIPSFLDRRNL